MYQLHCSLKTHNVMCQLYSKTGKRWVKNEKHHLGGNSIEGPLYLIQSFINYVYISFIAK